MLSDSAADWPREDAGLERRHAHSAVELRAPGRLVGLDQQPQSAVAELVPGGRALARAPVGEIVRNPAAPVEHVAGESVLELELVPDDPPVCRTAVGLERCGAVRRRAGRSAGSRASSGVSQRSSSISSVGVNSPAERRHPPPPNALRPSLRIHVRRRRELLVRAAPAARFPRRSRAARTPRRSRPGVPCPSGTTSRRTWAGARRPRSPSRRISPPLARTTPSSPAASTRLSTRREYGVRAPARVRSAARLQRPHRASARQGSGASRSRRPRPGARRARPANASPRTRRACRPRAPPHTGHASL